MSKEHVKTPFQGTEIMDEILGLEKFLPIIRKLARNCVNCDKFDYCVTRAIQGTGITLEDIMMSYLKLQEVCNKYHETGFTIKMNIMESV